MKYFITFVTSALFVLGGFAQNKNIVQLGYKSYPNSTLHGRTSDVWGYVDTTGKEYAIVGLQRGVSIVDVTDPSNLTEVFYTSGASSIWRDIKTWNKHAYITNETSGGLMIIDMSNLPGAITSSDVSYHTGSSYPFTSAHNIYIDENGLGYIFGANYGKGGAIFLDLNNNPKAPQEVGVFDSLYFHDGMARGDTLWGSAVYQGVFAAIDVSNRSNPTIMATYFTSGFFTHNNWISDDGNTLFTTDEISSGAIGAYDVSDLSNIDELDIIRSNPGSGVIPHNTHVYGDFLVTSYYRDGLTIVDATMPDRLVQVADFDTSPLLAGNGFNGCWGAYPYLPSGNVLATDIERGLYVLGVDYVKGVYLEGNTRAFSDSSNLGNTQIIDLNGGINFSSNLNAFYKNSYADSGLYQFAFFKPGYLWDTLNVYMQSGQLHVEDVYLRRSTTFILKGSVRDMDNGDPVPFSDIYMVDGNLQYRAQTDADGNFSINGVYEGDYTITAGKWTYKNSCERLILTGNDSIGLEIEEGIYDDFTFENGWLSATSISKGMWEKQRFTENLGIPLVDEPNGDVIDDCNDFAYVTGRSGSSNHDVDGGSTWLYSPWIDMSDIKHPMLDLAIWFRNDAPSGMEDTLHLFASSDSVNYVPLAKIHNAMGITQSEWIDTSFAMWDKGLDLDHVLIMARIEDLGDDHLLEAGIDRFEVTGPFVGIDEAQEGKELVSIYPNPFEGVINYELRSAFKLDAIKISDVSGRVVSTMRTQQAKGQIQLSDEIPGGLYLVEFISIENERLVRRVLKKP